MTTILKLIGDWRNKNDNNIKAHWGLAAWVLNKNNNNINAHGEGEWLAKTQQSVLVYPKFGTLTTLYAGRKVGLALERTDRALDYIWGSRGQIVFILDIKSSIFFNKFGVAIPAENTL